MSNRIFILLVVVALLAAGCSADLADDVFRKKDDPSLSAPVVRSFLVERTLGIEWSPDSQCDEYILYRDTDPAGAFDSVVHRGNDTRFDDTNLEADTFYYYRLAKRLGTMEFPKSDYTTGVATFSRQDEYEYNDTKETAVRLANTTNGNIYYYNDSAGNIFEDMDWYYVHLEPAGTEKSSVRLIINEYSVNIEAGDIRYNFEGKEPLPLYQGQPFDIVNEKDAACDIYFQISVNKEKATNPFVNRMGNYKLSIVYYQ